MCDDKDHKIIIRTYLLDLNQDKEEPIEFGSNDSFFSIVWNNKNLRLRAIVIAVIVVLVIIF